MCLLYDCATHIVAHKSDNPYCNVSGYNKARDILFGSGKHCGHVFVGQAAGETKARTVAPLLAPHNLAIPTPVFTRHSLLITFMRGIVDSYQDWIGKSEEAADHLTPSPAQRMAATLNKSETFVEGTALPPAWHWLYFLPAVRLDHTGEDGHAKRGGFLPPVTLPRRMWAGGRIAFDRPLHIGEKALRKSTDRQRDHQAGQERDAGLCAGAPRDHRRTRAGAARRTGHRLPRTVERAAPARVTPAPAEPQFAREITPDPVLLFRYSALTFNSHRIHYDRTYCTEVEGYPGLVVHGPLTATLLLDLLARTRAGSRGQVIRVPRRQPALRHAALPHRGAHRRRLGAGLGARSLRRSGNDRNSNAGVN